RLFVDHQVLCNRSRGILAVREHDYLLDDFESVWVVGDAAAEEAAGPVAQNLVVDEKTLEAVKAGLPNLLVTDGGELVLLKTAGDFVFGSPILGLQFSRETVWGASENLPYNTEFCVFGVGGQSLYCSTPIDPQIHTALIEHGESTQRSQFGEWSHNGESHFAILSTLPLPDTFGADTFDIVAMQTKSFALQSGTDFRRIFIPVLITVFVLVGFLTMYLVAQNLRPLQNLTIAARQIASGNLSSRVRVRTNDEFELLAEAFNNMADRLGRQIATLEAMSGIDRMILTGTKLEEVSEDIVGHLMMLTECKAAGVIARDSDDPKMGTMVSICGRKVSQERLELPEGIDERWFHAQQAELRLVEPAMTPYGKRFVSYGKSFVVQIPVLLNDKLKGLLLLGFDERYDMSHSSLLRCIDLAGRFAVALSSVEREEALYRQAHFDQLTGLPNRQLLKDTLAQYLANARHKEQTGALLFLDLDRFKEINDVFGHSVGDSVLSQSAQRIVSVVRDRDTVARLGGDEFVVILPDVRNDKIVRATAERLLDKLSEAFTVSDIDHYVSASIGIAMFPEDGATVDTVIKNADAAMYRAKEAGRSRYEFFSIQHNAESRRKIGIERDLRAAFNNGELEVFYQPQFEIDGGEMSGAEALLRWMHPEQGAISPDEFIPLAEDSELIVEIGSWVIERTCEDLSKMYQNGWHPGPVSINVSARQLADENFAQTVLEPIRAFDFSPSYMQIEVTETTVAQNRDTAIAILQELREHGIRVAIDDFGTGYSSLSYLQQMPFDCIKIDKSFVDRVGRGVTSDNICRTIIKMAEQLGKKSIAEGVESWAQLNFLRESGCDYVQGFLFSTPLSAKDFADFVAKQDYHTRRREALEIVK
ncbi:MAG: EAL domain-containing protein, partial [Pseudomonadota bacterium]